MKIKGNATFEIIQGDTFERTVSFENLNVGLIDKVYFVSKELGIQKELARTEDNKFILILNWDETCNFPEKVCCYDLKVHFINNKRKTLEYRGQLKVYDDWNKVNE